jgi:phage shock protein A
MTEEKVIKVSDMIRTTAENSTQFMQQIADHIDKLEDGIVKLQTRIEELEKQHVLDHPSQ